MAIGLSGPVFGQEADDSASLPEITVEAGAPAPAPRQVYSAPATPAPAQPAPEPAESAETDAISESDVPYTVPASVSTAGRGEIETFGSYDLNSIFRSMPGTSTRESISNPGIAVNIRGLEGSGRVNMMIDGVRQNFGITGHEASGFAYVDPQLLAGIDVERGAVTTVGGGSLAGSANMRTLDVQDILRPGQNYGALVTGSWGSNGVGWAEMGAVAAQSGRVSVAGAVSKHDENDYENGNGETVPNTNEDLISGLVKAHIDITPAARLSFGTVLYNNHFTANSYDQAIRSNIYTTKFVYNPAANNWIDFEGNLNFSDVEMEYYDYYDPLGGGSYSGRHLQDRGTGFNAANTSRFNIGEIAVATEYGAEYNHDDANALNGGVNPEGEQTTFGAFSETTFSYGIWDLTAGLRYDYFKTEGEGAVAVGGHLGIPSGPYSVDDSDGRLDPKITLAAQVKPWLMPYVTYSESMRAPTVAETLMGGVHPGTTSFFYPNPYLEPETQKGWELGFNVMQNDVFTAGDRFRFKADYYDMNVDNYITACESDLVINFGFYSMSPYYFCNTPGRSNINGVEIEGFYDAGAYYAGMTYTYTHTDLPSQLDGLGAHSYLPDHVATFDGGVRLMDQRWVIGSRLYFASEAYVGEVNVAAGEDPYDDGYGLVDLYTSYELRNGLDVGLTISNLLDKAYTPALSTGATGAIAGLDTGRGRTFLLTARGQF
ncbi:TonB-dependent receptor [Methyloligella sp. 2.7D]|uniref:TonB-dependent receptor domain-containing protein n=1 Tax=unclassified Methyloligella TaxID=2625955 RepID=UPI001FED4378|nr:TonB-dependent receptor [Methyloligella sp. GL2]